MSFLTLFLRDSRPSPALAHEPSSNIATWDATNAAKFGTGNIVSLLAASGTSTITYSVTNQPINNTTKHFGLAQFASPLLAAQSVAALNWIVAICGGTGSAFGTQKHGNDFGLYLIDGTTGGLKTTIVARQNVGTNLRSSANFLTGYSTTVAGASFTAANGDYLVVEIGLEVNTTTNMTGIGASSKVANSTVISSDNVSNANPKAFITAPTTIYVPGELVSLPGFQRRLRVFDMRRIRR